MQVIQSTGGHVLCWKKISPFTVWTENRRLKGEPTADDWFAVQKKR